MGDILDVTADGGRDGIIVSANEQVTDNGEAPSINRIVITPMVLL